MAAAEIIGAIGTALGGAAAAAGAGSSIGAGLKSKKKMKFAAELNHKYSEMAAEAAYRRQMEMYERAYQDESYQNRVKQMREAGLSVGLMYGQGAQGGGAGATTGAPAGNTNQNIDPGLNAEAAENANVTRGGLALVEASRNVAQIKNIESQTDLNEAAAKKAEADAAAARENAGLTAEKKITEVQSREVAIEKMRQEGIHEWIDNIVRKRFAGLTKEEALGEDLDMAVEVRKYVNEGLGEEIQYRTGSLLDEREARSVLKTMAETTKEGSLTEANKALAALNNERANNYWQELLNATATANAAQVNAAANKLAAEWNAGEKYHNVNYWLEIAAKVTGDVIEGIVGAKAGAAARAKAPNKK